MSWSLKLPIACFLFILRYYSPFMTKPLYSKAGLFLGTFVSALLLVFGLGTIASTVAPVLVIKFFTGRYEYHPQLPLAQAREEEFFDIDSVPVKQLYPALTSPQNVTGGDQILIPSLNVQVPVVMSASLEDDDVVAALASGVALYPNGILPGRLGNAFIAGHSTGNPWQGKYRFAFLEVDKLKPGDQVHVDYGGARYTYQFTDSEIVTPDPSLRVISDRPKPTLTLMTCTPIWSTKYRLLQYFELTNITKLTPDRA